MSGGLSVILLVAGSALLWGACSKPSAATTPDDGYGYEYIDDPLASSDAGDDKPLTSCAGAWCRPPNVCRVLALEDPGDKVRAYCLSPKSELCKIDPELCQPEICRKSPGICQ